MKPRNKSGFSESVDMESSVDVEERISICNRKISCISLYNVNNRKCIKLLFGMTYHPVTIQNWDYFLKITKKSFLKRYSNVDKTPINYNNIVLRKILAEGNFSRIELMTKKNNNELFAVKIFDKKKIIDLNMAKRVIMQKQILKSIRFPFVIYLESFFQDSRYIYLVIPYLAGGTMLDQLKTSGQLSEPFVRFYAAQILLALEYLHYMDIIYRDLKPENIMFDHNGYIKLIDFIFAKKLIDNNRTYTCCGTIDYIAPEIILQKGYDKSADWWSFGVLLYELCYGQVPFHEDTEEKIIENISLGNFKIPRWFSNHFKSLLKNLLQTNVINRLGCLYSGAKDIKKHEWFESIDWLAMVNRTLKPPFELTIRHLRESILSDGLPVGEVCSDADKCGE